MHDLKLHQIDGNVMRRLHPIQPHSWFDQTKSGAVDFTLPSIWLNFCPSCRFLHVLSPVFRKRTAAKRPGHSSTLLRTAVDQNTACTGKSRASLECMQQLAPRSIDLNHTCTRSTATTCAYVPITQHPVHLHHSPATALPERYMKPRKNAADVTWLLRVHTDQKKTSHISRQPAPFLNHPTPTLLLPLPRIPLSGTAPLSAITFT